VKVRVKYFGLSAEKCGCAMEDISVDKGETAADLKKKILDLHPGLSGTKFQLAVDRNLASGTELIQENSEIAVLPPFAGG
jgi:molybdopterin converting factor subunit 1